MKALNLKQQKYNVLFFANWQPIHGLEIVAEAIARTQHDKDIQFTLIGDKNELRTKAEKYLKKHTTIKNYKFVNNVSKKQLIKSIQESNLVLAGSYADNEKSRIVVRNAVYETMACAKLMLVPDTPANKELGLKDGENCLMCKIGNSKSLAEKIIEARTNYY